MGRGTHHGGPGGGLKTKDPGREPGPTSGRPPSLPPRIVRCSRPAVPSRPAGLGLVLAFGVLGGLEPTFDARGDPSGFVLAQKRRLTAQFHCEPMGVRRLPFSSPNVAFGACVSRDFR